MAAPISPALLTAAIIAPPFAWAPHAGPMKIRYEHPFRKFAISQAEAARQRWNQAIPP
jgi:hypothetical protein